MTTRFGRVAYIPRRVVQQSINVLLVASVLLTGLVWSGQVWGQDRPARVGFLTFFAVDDNPRMAAFLAVVRKTLAELQWIEGKNVQFKYRNADGDPARFDHAAASLVDLDVDVIFASSASARRAGCS